MAVTGIVRIVLSRLFFRPSGLLVLAILLCAWPSLLVLAPIGISSNGFRPEAWSYELALLGMAAGTVLATKELAGLAPLLHRLPSAVSLTAEMATLVSAGIFGAGLALLPASALVGATTDLRAPGLGARFCLSVAASAAGGALLSRLRLPAGMVPWILGMSVILAPLVLAGPALQRALGPLAAALLLSAWLLDHRPDFSP
jgi:hypothetical protein